MRKSAPASRAPSTGATLRSLFLTLFLRGRTSQGLNPRAVPSSTPTSIPKKLTVVLGLYALIGLTAFALVGSPLFVLSAYLHGFTFLMIGMFLVTSAGEALFDKDEAEILLYRPVSVNTLLWAKVTVLLQVAFFLSLAINFVGLFAGLETSDSNLLFPIVHLVSTAEESLFCASCVVLMYQLCLRYIGRQRLENVMTTMQVVLMAGLMIGSQVLPRFVMGQMMNRGSEIARPWWLGLIPPGWFAGLDDAIAGSHDRSSWLLAGIGVCATASVSWLAFTKLAKTYESGLQAINEAPAPTAGQSRQLRIIGFIADRTPVRYWLRNPVERVGFVLTGAYVIRDREIKLRVFPALTTVLMMPIMMMVSSRMPMIPHVRPGGAAYPMPDTSSIFASMGTCMGAAFLGSAPLTILTLLSFTQQWKASELFLVAPLPGPWPLQRGAMVAVTVLLLLPLGVLLLAFCLYMGYASGLPLLLPGLFLIPFYGRLPALLQKAVPLSRPTEGSTAAARGCLTMGAPFFALLVGFVALGIRTLGWPSYVLMLVVEASAVGLYCYLVKEKLETARWQTFE